MPPKAYIEPDKCRQCQQCEAAKICPPKAIFKIDPQEPAIVDANICHGCGYCIAACPAKAIVLRGK